MTDLRTAAQQALEALETLVPTKGPSIYNSARDALRAALAQQAEPLNLSDPAVQKRLATQWGYVPAAQAEPVEPVAWSGYDLDGMVEAFSRVIEAHYQRANPFQNPIDMDAQMALRVLRGFIPAMKAYTAPPQRKPLTEEEIEACRQQGYAHAGFSAPFDFGKAARAVERAHGIKEN